MGPIIDINQKEKVKTMESKKKFNMNILVCAFVAGISLVFLIASFFIEDKLSATFPKILCGLSIALSILYFIQILCGKHNEEFDFTGTGRACLACLVIIGYLLSNYLFGYYIATVIFLPVCMLFLGQRNWKVIAGVTVGLPLFLYLLLDLVMEMQMPQPLLF